MDYKKIHLMFVKQLEDHTKSLSLEEGTKKYIEQIKKMNSQKFEEQIEDYKKEFKKFKSHWMAISIASLFGLVKDIGKKHPFTELDKLTKSDLNEIWDTAVLNTIKDKNPDAVRYIDKYYLGYMLGDKESMSKFLKFFLKECFGSDRVHPNNEYVVMFCIKQAMDIHVENIKKLLN